MTSPTNRAIRLRNSLLICATVSLLAALLMGFWPWSLITSPPMILAVVLIVGVGFFTALAGRELAGLLFDMDREPWYAQPGGLLFLLFILVIVNVLCLLAIRFVRQIAPHLPMHASPALFLAVIASQLSWVVLVDWVSSPVQDRARFQPDRADIADQQGPDTSPLPPLESSGTPRSGSKPRADTGERRKPAKKTRNRTES